jgi:hypothetical protein
MALMRAARAATERSREYACPRFMPSSFWMGGCIHASLMCMAASERAAGTRTAKGSATADASIWSQAWWKAHASEEATDLVGEFPTGIGRAGAPPYPVGHLQVLLHRGRRFGEGLGSALPAGRTLVEGTGDVDAQQCDDGHDQGGRLNP